MTHKVDMQLSGLTSGMIRSYCWWNPLLPPYPMSPGYPPIASPLMDVCPMSLELHPPYTWDSETVAYWIHWCNEEYSLSIEPTVRIHLNGKALCLLSKEDLIARFPSSGDVLHSALQKITAFHKNLQSSSFPTYEEPRARTGPDSCSLSPLNIKPVRAATYRHAPEPAESPVESVSPDITAYSPPPPPPPLTVKNASVRLLWDFLYQLLESRDYADVVRWTSRDDHVFTIVQPNELARLWGVQKNHAWMTFDKMSRSLRYYYKMNILRRESGKRHCYRFLRSPQQLRHFKQREIASLHGSNRLPGGAGIDSPRGALLSSDSMHRRRVSDWDSKHSNR